jgi:hypothetical protein
MTPAAVDAALQQANAFTERLIDTFERDVAAGEVGEGGSAFASDEPIIAPRPPTALLYGRVQSGKTVAMILTSALALDHGFRVIVVLTADNVALVEQTVGRFKALDGPRVFSTFTEDQYEWVGIEDEIAEDLPAEGLVLVCSKNSFQIPEVLQFLTRIGASSYPALVLDDEADAATPDTTMKARTSGRSNAPEFPSTIYRRVVENVRPGEEGESIREFLPHSIFVQVTATPFVLLLQNSRSRLRPTFISLLEPGAGYCGGQEFFGTFRPTDAVPPAPLVIVDPNDALQLARRIPAGLVESINLFLVSSAGRAQSTGTWPEKGFKHLSHASHRIGDHTLLSEHVERYVSSVRRRLRDDGNSITMFEAARNELLRTYADCPPLTELAPYLMEMLRQSEVIRVNSEAGAIAYGPRANFLIGGNILGRGLTIDDLLVTYYVREAKVSQMDTVWQHARMYGYRTELMPFTRVYLTRSVAGIFADIHRAEEELRNELRTQANDVLIRVPNRGRATRPGALPDGELRTIRSNLDQIQPNFLVRDPASAVRIRDILIENEVPISEPDRSQRSTPVPLEVVQELVEAVPVREGDPGRWSPGAVAALLGLFTRELNGVCNVYVRAFEPDEPLDEERTRGRLSGPEIRIIRATSAPNAPILVLIAIGDPESPEGWFPELVLPAGVGQYITNVE